VLGNEDEAQVAALLQQPDTLLGLSDAGAHASQLCDACYSTYLLGYWVRQQRCLSLEAAVWRLTGQPADVFRIRGRGRIAPGYAADLVAFDPDTVGVEPLERVWDLPAGADRLIARSRGVESMWVNGERTRAAGVELDGVRPGRLLRATRDD
jgi:N-acyl-D-aspartate/D-glutamate deacylase